MYFVMDAHSFYNFIYFILLIIVSDSSGPRGDGGSWGNRWGNQRGEGLPGLRTSPGEMQAERAPVVTSQEGI